MAPVAALLLLALAASTDAAPSGPTQGFNVLSALWKRYYGDSQNLARPAPLMDKRAGLPAGWSGPECVTESSHERLLQGFSFSSALNTPSMCINECAKRGFTIAGTEYADECYCGHSFTGSGGVSVPLSLCSKPCAGDPSSNCGEAWLISLYTFNSTLDSLLCQGATSPITTTSTVPRPPQTTTTTKTPTTTTATTTTKTPTTTTTTKTPTTTTTTTTKTPTTTTTTTTKTPTTTTTTTTKTPTTTTTTTAKPTPTTTATTTTTVTPTPTTVAPKPTIPASNEQHFVWAHHIVGNTYPYTQSNWADDIGRAKAQGIDGFALNIGSDVWESNRVQLAYRAAEAAGGFKLFLSLDMSSLSCSSSSDANNLVNLVKAVASSPAQATYKNKILVSTFSGETCTFGTGSITAWKTSFKDVLAASSLPIYFVPAFFIDTSKFSTYDWLDGELNWNSAWPMGDYDITASTTDATYLSAIGSKTYMASVSPFFFTHFGAATWNKNWIYRSDDWLYCTRWEQIIAMRDKMFMTELLTWNDYGESSYIGPISGMLPATSNLWVDNMNHVGLTALTNYYATAYKTGAYPAITQDTLTLWSRPHPANANAAADSVGRPTNWQWTQDNLYAVVLAKAPATVVLVSGATSQTFNVPAGMTKLKIPSAVGSIGGSITRNGVTVVNYSSGNNFKFEAQPQLYNYNYYVAAASG